MQLYIYFLLYIVIISFSFLLFVAILGRSSYGAFFRENIPEYYDDF